MGEDAKGGNGKTAKVKEEKKYKVLTKNFFRGSVPGQIASVYKVRTEKPEKLAEFKIAVKDGDCKLDKDNHKLTSQQVKKLDEMGVFIPSNLRPAPPAAKPAATPASA